MTKTIRQAVFFMSCLIATIMTASRPVLAADIFLDAATNPTFQRDVHLVAAGSNRVASADTSDNQNTGITNNVFGVASNVWNNEHNQVLAGVEIGRREFDKRLALPDGFAMPDRLDTASAGFLFKHITSDDWAVSQGVRYTQSRTNLPSITVRDTIDLVGMVAVSRKPGVVWAFGYIYAQSFTKKDYLSPIIEYVNTAHDRWAITVGYPVLAFSVSPHPDWMFGTGAGVSYKVTEQNIIRLSYTADDWAYRLKGPDVKPVAYTSNRPGLDWTYLYHIDHRTIVVLNAALGWEFNRKLGSDNKLDMGNAAVMGFNASYSF
jgi:hypothetical protein